MKPRGSHIHRSAGFTLLELLLAMVVFAVVLAAINGVFFGALRLRNKTAQNLERAVPVQHALGVIRRDLAGIQLPAGRFAGILNTSAAINGENETETGTEFVTSTGVLTDREPWGEIQRIAYVLRRPTNNIPAKSSTARNLVRVSNRNLLPPVQDQPTEQHLLSDVELVEYSFYDGLTWRNTWNSTNETTTLPRAIRMNLTLAREPLAQGQVMSQQPPPRLLQLVVPVMLTPVTNSPASATASVTTVGGAR